MTPRGSRRAWRRSASAGRSGSRRERTAVRGNRATSSEFLTRHPEAAALLRGPRRATAPMVQQGRPVASSGAVHPSSLAPKGARLRMTGPRFESKERMIMSVQEQPIMVRYETDEKVGIITLDRADKLNAINSAMKDQIIAALARADKEPSTSVIVLRANGRSFSAGFDIGHSPDRGKDTGAADPNTWDPILHRSFDFGIAPWSTTKPVIASVQGHVLGGGCELALMCDLTIAADDARFGEPEVRFSHLGPLMVMPWFIGLTRARELLFFGDTIDAKTALQFGMINRIVPVAELREATMKYAKRLSLISPEALRWGKRVINRGAEIAGFRAALEAGVDSFVSLYSIKTEVGKEFGRIVQEKNLKAALEWRTAQFRE